MERPVSLILIAVLAVIQGILGILQAFDWLRIGLDLRGRGVHALPILSAVAFTQGMLVLVLALLYILFALGALFGQRWAWGLGLGVSLVTCLVVVVSFVLVGALMRWSLLWLIIPVVLVGYLLSPVGHKEFRR